MDHLSNSNNSTKTEDVVDVDLDTKKVERQASAEHSDGSFQLGIVYAVLYGISLGAMFILQKLGQDVSGINVMHMVVVRQACILIGGYIHGKAVGEDHSKVGWEKFRSYPKETKRLLYLRCFIDWVASVLVIFAVMLIPVSLTVSVSRLSVFFTPLLALLIDNEKVTKYEICTIAGGFLGVVLIMNPTLFDSSEDDAADIQRRQERDRKSHPHYYLGLCMTVLFAIVAAVGVVCVRLMNKSGVQRVPANLQVYFYGVFTTCLVLLASLFISPDIFAIWNLFSSRYPIGYGQFLWYLSIGFFCWLYTCLAPLALQFIKSSTFIPFTNLAIVMSFVFDLAYFGRVLFWSDYVGAVLIIMCTVVQSRLAVDHASGEDDDYTNEHMLEREDCKTASDIEEDHRGRLLPPTLKINQEI